MASTKAVLDFFLISNVLGGNFALVGIPSVGASGAIFGTVAVRFLYSPGIRFTLTIGFIRSLG